jgi:hypothetical protein
MPYVREWENPEVVLRHRGVVVHEFYEDEDDEDPAPHIYAIYKPDSLASDGAPIFYSLEYDEPVCAIDIAEMRRLPGIEPHWRDEDVLENLIDRGILTQSGLDEDKAYSEEPYFPPDTQTIPLPFDELKPEPTDPLVYGREVAT